MNTVKAWGATSASSGMAPLAIDRREPRDNDVEVVIEYCGVCHSDLHSVEDDWGVSSYPLVPGHEIIGRVSRVGAQVTRFQAGDIVGVGCMVDSCQQCTACNSGEEQFCAEGAVLTYGSQDRQDHSRTQGGYSQKIVVREEFVLRIPDKLNPATAAPILCAGITTYSPLKHLGVGKGHKLGVIGMGGLGHMGVKLGKALGAEVTLFTRSSAKADEARAAGADHVVISTDASEMAQQAGQFDFMLDTVPVGHDINPYLECLKYNGAHIIVGQLTPFDEPVQAGALVVQRRSLMGSFIGGVKQTQELLEFCAEHDIACDVEMLEISNINAAFERLKKGDVKYRFVIDMGSFQ